jgi:hypothetical protein
VETGFRLFVPSGSWDFGNIWGCGDCLKNIPEAEEFYTRINPLLTIEAKMNQAKPWETKFYLKNEGSFRLHNVEVIMEFIRADLGNIHTAVADKPEKHVFFPDVYRNVGDIPATSEVPISLYLRQHMNLSH